MRKLFSIRAALSVTSLVQRREAPVKACVAALLSRSLWFSTSSKWLVLAQRDVAARHRLRKVPVRKYRRAMEESETNLGAGVSFPP